MTSGAITVAIAPARTEGEVDIEIFPCAGGMAEGFRRAGFTFDIAIEIALDHVASYEANLGHRPICMDARDFLRLLQAGLRVRCRLLVADPPCTPWSRAGKRKGLEDDRDMLRVTAQIVELLRPRVYLIGNVPGLEDSQNLRTVQEVIGGLARYGYCTADFARLDAADYGVPQHRIRPFWFGHLEGPCLRWPAPTHADRADLQDQVLPGFESLLPYVTCGEALAHLSPKELGRRVKLRKRDCNGKQHGSLFGKPARVVGTSNLSDGNVVLAGVARVGQIKRAAERGLRRAMAETRGHPPSKSDRPANAVRASDGGGAKRAMVMDHKVDRTLAADRPARTVLTTMGDGAQPFVPARAYKRSTQGPQSQRVAPSDRPATTVQCREDRLGSGMMIDWMHERPATTVMGDPRLAPPGTRDKNWKVKGGGRQRSTRDAIMLSPKAAAILQGFPEGWTFTGKTKRAVWSQIGQAMPPALAEAVARAIAVQLVETVPGELPPGFVESFTPAPAPVERSPAEQLSLDGGARMLVPLPPDAVEYSSEAS